MENFKYHIIRNDRKGYGYEDDNLQCNNCGSLTTRYIMFNDIMLCRGCLDQFDKMCANDLLQVVLNK